MCERLVTVLATVYTVYAVYRRRRTALGAGSGALVLDVSGRMCERLVAVLATVYAAAGRSVTGGVGIRRRRKRSTSSWIGMRVAIRGLPARCVASRHAELARPTATPPCAVAI
jgi:hypothetical protein